MRTVTAYDLGAFAAQAITRQNTAHGLGAHVVNVKTAADPALARKETNPFVIRGRVNADQIAARDRAVAGLAQPSLDKEYAASGFSGFRLKPVGEYGQASGGATFPLEYQIVATGPDGQEQLINTIKSRNAQTEPNLNPSNINKMVQQGAQRLGMKAGPKPPAPRPPIAADKFLADLAAGRAAEPAANKTPAPAAPAPVAQAPARPAPAPVAPATPPPAPAQPDQIGPTAPITTDNALGGPNGGQPSPPEPEPASAPTPATLDPFKITQLGSSLVTPETRTKVNPGWPTPRTTALSDYHETHPKLRRNGPAMYADPSEQYHADMLNNNLMPRVDTWEQRPDGSFRSDNTEQSHAYAQPTLRMADEVRREQAAVGNNPADYPESDAGPNGPNAGNYVPPAAPEPEPISELKPPEMLPKLNNQTVLAQRMNFENSRRQEEYDQTLKQRQDVGNNNPYENTDYPTQAPAPAQPGYDQKVVDGIFDNITNPATAYSQQEVDAISDKLRIPTTFRIPTTSGTSDSILPSPSINDLGFSDPSYVPPTATPTSEPTYSKKPLTRAQQSVGNVGAFSQAGVAKTRKQEQQQAKSAPAAAAPKAPSVPVTPPQPPIPTPEQPKPTPPPVPPPAPEPAPTPAPATPQYRPSAPAAPAYRPPAQAAPAPRQTIGGGLFGRRRR